MSNKIVQYLQTHIDGEVVDAPSVRQHFATDRSIFEALPQLVVYPKNTSGIRKVARFSWQLAERGHSLPLTARGKGSNQSGSAVGKGMVVALPAHMNRLLELEVGKGTVRVQPGMSYRALQDVLNSHGLFLPPFPASIDYSTIGGAIATNASGYKSVKYGTTRKYVKGLEVVLSNGDVIKTERLSKRELSSKKGQTDLEGEIYRQVDGLLTDNAELIEKLDKKTKVTKNSSGYALEQVKDKDGSFDLTPLFVGSEGTLGIITEATLDCEGFNPKTTLLAAQFDSLEKCVQLLEPLRALGPSAVEIVDRNLLELVNRTNPAILKDLVQQPLPAAVLLVEFDDPSDRSRKKKVKKALKMLDESARSHDEAETLVAQERLWSILHSAWVAFTYEGTPLRALPIVEDGIVPPKKFLEFIQKAYVIFDNYSLPMAAWGHAGDGHLHIYPFLDISRLNDRQKAIKVMDDYYALVTSLGGSFSGSAGDGRSRGSYLEDHYGKEVYNLFVDTKRIFDPHNILNPGIKIHTTKAESMALLRREYSLADLGDYLVEG
ncbi:MAG TPA: FAD-binding oxidoreductase [Candidatus Saccharimonadales bacterium]|nr:FAD-binding oxidoreductase [Candidatus Saccharimonadales bacterium]